MESDNQKVPVSRADRFGRAAAGASKKSAVEVQGIFKKDFWNGRLQVPREQLRCLGRYVEKHGWDNHAIEMRDRLKWTLTLSLNLSPYGPWMEYATRNGLKTDPKYSPHASLNKERGDMAKKNLDSLPRIRILSVDLGLRHAAACAVWETVSTEQVMKACMAAGQKKPSEEDMYVHLRESHPEKKSKKGETVKYTIYRRIGPDTLPDKKPHPAPWARLDRQFIIKLQGEKKKTRKASNKEIWAVHCLERNLGHAVPLIDRLVATGWGSTVKQQSQLEALKTLGWKPIEGRMPESNSNENGYRISLLVGDLMASSVHNMCLALKRHGDRARIAYYLVADEKTKPGGAKEKLNAKGRIEIILDALVLWHNLFSSPMWRDDYAKNLWDEHIASLAGLKIPVAIGERLPSMGREKKQKVIKEMLYPLAKALAGNKTLCDILHEAWKKRWEADDALWENYIRWFKDWILPRKKKIQRENIRRKGGLSLARLSVMENFRKLVQVAYATRLRPDGSKGFGRERLGQRLMDALDNLREQRAKQIASRIIEAALGIGSEGKGWERNKRPRERIQDPRFAPCHAVVIENLNHYRPKDIRLRRENRRLAAWSVARVKQFLSEACELHGLHLHMVNAGYTSLQDSRTGAPGIRCQDVTVTDFMRSGFWREQVTRADKRVKSGEKNTLDDFLVETNSVCESKMSEMKQARVLRLPLKGGKIFVSANPRSPAAKGINADLNAAANIGLAALNDPDWPGKWWYVPCDANSMTPVENKVKGSPVVPKGPMKKLTSGEGKDTVGKKRRQENTCKTRKIVNLWRDVSALPLDGGKDEWKEYAEYINDVRNRVIEILKG